MAFRSGIDPAHLLAEVRRLVPREQQEAAMSLLEQVQGYWWDTIWVRLAVLNLAGGRVDLIPQWIGQDPRDIKMATLRYLDPTWDARFRWPPAPVASSDL